MQLQIDLPETLTLQTSDHLAPPASTMETGLNVVIERSPLSTDEVPDILDFLSDFQQRCDWMRRTLSAQHHVD